jgi:hypothetical protein
MPFVGGRSSVLAGWAGLCALGACATVPDPSAESRPAPPVEACALSHPPEIPVAAEALDSARITFTASGITRGACALRLVSHTLRPWPTLSHAHWTVHVALDDTGATARHLGRDGARDTIDTGLAFVATEDLALVAYASARPDLEVAPLPWDRTYFRLSSSADASLGAEPLADAVGVDARPAQLASCDTGFASDPVEVVKGQSSRVVYEAGDRTARELAERFVALTSGSATAALAPHEFDRALRTGNELAYIVSVPRGADSGCETLESLHLRAPWSMPRSIVPLIDTRAYAIVPRDSPP